MCHYFIRHLQITRKPIYQSAPCVFCFLQMLLSGWGHQEKCAELSSVPLFAFSSHLMHLRQWSYWLVVVDIYFSFTSHHSQTQPYSRVWYLAHPLLPLELNRHYSKARESDWERKEKMKLSFLWHCWECWLIYSSFLQWYCKCRKSVALCDL